MQGPRGTFSTSDSRPWRRPAPALRSRRGCPTQATTAVDQSRPEPGLYRGHYGRGRSAGSADFMSAVSDGSRRTWPRASPAVSRPASRGCRSRTPLVIHPQPLVRSADRGRARPCRAAGDRSVRRGRAAGRQERSDYHVGHRGSLPRERPAPAGVRRSRRRRASRRRRTDACRDRGAGRGGRAKATQPSCGRDIWRRRGWRRSRRSACDASASAVRWHWRRGRGFVRAAQALRSEGSFAGLGEPGAVPPRSTAVFAADRCDVSQLSARSVIAVHAWQH